MPPIENSRIHPLLGRLQPIRKIQTEKDDGRTKIYETKSDDIQQLKTDTKTPKDKEYVYKMEIVWPHVMFFIAVYSFAAYGVFLSGALFRAKLATLIFTYAYISFGGLGITAGVHRLWCHRSYKANIPLRIFLMFAHSATAESDIYEWVRDHRVHHKFVDTDADPYNAKRGLFFSHIGWLMCKKHRDVIEKGKIVDMSDIYADSVITFQRKYFAPMLILWAFIIPSVVPWYFWGEDGWTSFVLCMIKYVYLLNITWSVNSFAHFSGMKPYDKNITPSQNLYVTIITHGEGWHNYHHAFPWDFRTAELGNYKYNITTAFISLMGKIGWATELKTASDDIIKKRMFRTGDGSSNNGDHEHHPDDGPISWGWGDTEMIQDEIKQIKIR